METDASGNPQAYYLYDGLGSVANVADASGNVLVSYTYDAFGTMRTQTASSTNFWGFAGEQRDDESGFIYLRERYYDTESGRFLSTDRLGGGYPYAGGNPVNLIDPSGLAATVVCDAWAGGTCVAAHFEGTVDELQTELDTLGNQDSQVADILEAAINSGGAPLDEVASPSIVVVDTNGNGEGDSTVVGESTVVRQCSCTAGADAQEVTTDQGGNSDGCGLICGTIRVPDVIGAGKALIQGAGSVLVDEIPSKECTLAALSSGSFEVISAFLDLRPNTGKDDALAATTEWIGYNIDYYEQEFRKQCDW